MKVDCINIYVLDNNIIIINGDIINQGLKEVFPLYLILGRP